MTVRDRVALIWFTTGIILAGYLGLLLSNTCYFATGPDASGYLSHGRLLATGRTAVPIVPMLEAGLPSSLAYVFTPYGFVSGQEPGTMVPVYPVGAPLHFAAAAFIGGWRNAPFTVAPLAAIGCLWMLFLVAREFELEVHWCIAGAAILAAMPLFISNALSAGSDLLASFWGLAAILCALKSKGHVRWSIAAGMAFAIGVAVRPTNLLFTLPMLASMGSRPRRLLIAALAACPFAIGLMVYHHVLYGNAFTTGYGPAGNVLNWRGFPACLSMHAMSLLSVMTPAVFPGGLAVAFCTRIARWRRIVLLSWFGAFFLFYAYYPFCPDISGLRFLIPALPGLIIGFLLTVRAVTASAILSGTLPRLIAGLGIAAVLGREIVLIGRMHVLHANEWEAIFPQTVSWVDDHVPEGSVVLSAIVSGAMYFEGGHITVRWDQLDPNTAAVLQATPRFKGDWYAVVSDVEGGIEHLRRRVPGEWLEVGRLRDVTFWRRVASPSSMKSLPQTGRMARHRRVRCSPRQPLPRVASALLFPARSRLSGKPLDGEGTVCFQRSSGSSASSAREKPISIERSSVTGGWKASKAEHLPSASSS